MARESRTSKALGPDPSEYVRDARTEAGQRILSGRFLTHGGTGVATPVTATASSVVVTMNATEFDENYGVVATPNWDTTCFVDTKTTTTFTINFGTAAPADATVDWIVFRA